MKIQKTYFELINFNQVAEVYLDRCIKKEAENKLCSAIKQFSKQLKNIFENYNDERDNLQLNNCSVEEKTKVILKDDKGNRQFTIEAEKKLKKELKELLLTKIECHARVPEGIDELIAELTEMERAVFSGIIIPEQQTQIYDDDV
ncbi:MAG TPA: hypothetical protein VJ455_04380 [Ignavibacteria bacterium]|nr:hypothetical protein [Ignavibacteria bacterium]